MIKSGSVKLHVDVTDFLLEDHQTVYQATQEDDEEAELGFKNMIFPFI